MFGQILIRKQKTTLTNKQKLEDFQNKKYVY